MKGGAQNDVDEKSRTSDLVARIGREPVRDKEVYFLQWTADDDDHVPFEYKSFYFV